MPSVSDLGSVPEFAAHVRAVHRVVAAGAPAGALGQKSFMLYLADENPARGPRFLFLGVTFKAQIGIGLNQHLRIDRTMRVVTDEATLAQSRMLEDERAGLGAMTLGAGLVQTCHRQPAGRFHDVAPVWVVALDAIQLPFEHRVMLRQVKLRVNIDVTTETRLGIAAGIDDELAATTADLDMPAAGAMTRFTTRFARHLQMFPVAAPVGADRKNPGDIGMTLVAGLIADVAGSFDLERDFGDRADRAAGTYQPAGQDNPSQSATSCQPTPRAHNKCFPV